MLLRLLLPLLLLRGWLLVLLRMVLRGWLLLGMLLLLRRRLGQADAVVSRVLPVQVQRQGRWWRLGVRWRVLRRQRRVGRVRGVRDVGGVHGVRGVRRRGRQGLRPRGQLMHIPLQDPGDGRHRGDDAGEVVPRAAPRLPPCRRAARRRHNGSARGARGCGGPNPR